MLLSSNVKIANIIEKMISILRHLSFSSRGELLKGAYWGVVNFMPSLGFQVTSSFDSSTLNKKCFVFMLEMSGHRGS